MYYVIKSDNGDYYQLSMGWGSKTDATRFSADDHRVLVPLSGGRWIKMVPAGTFARRAGASAIDSHI